MNVTVIGGAGHIGTYLVPRLVEAGHDVTVVSRGQRKPYLSHPAWSKIKTIEMDRGAAEKDGTFGGRVRSLDPDVVIDLICFTPESARHLVEALRGSVQHLLHCGTIWVHGPTTQAPMREDDPSTPFGDYGVRKAAIQSYLLAEARRGNLPVTILHPGHIVGPGWNVVNPAGNFNVEIFGVLARGETLALPNLGMETVHHVHADDVAQIFMRSIEHWSAAVGEAFHVVSPAAVTLKGYAETVAGWFGKKADLRLLPWEEWKKTASETDARSTHDHIAHSPCCSIEKARHLLGYAPRYTSFEAVREAVYWYVAQGKIRM